MAVFLQENFSPYSLGALSSQGSWNAQQGDETYPRIDVVDGSALGEAKAVTMIEGSPYALTGIDYVLPHSITEGRITFKALAQAGSAGQTGSQLFLLLLAGAIDLVSYSTDSLYVSFIEGSGAGSGYTEVTVWDNSGNSTATTAVPIDTVFGVNLIISSSGAVDVLINGVPAGFGTRQLYAGNETILRYGFSALHNDPFKPPTMSAFNFMDDKSPLPTFFQV